MTKYLVKWKSPPYGLTGGIDKQYDSEEQALEVCQFLQKVSELYVAPGLRKTFYVEPDMIKKEEVQMEVDELLDELRKQYGPPIARMQELVELGDTATGWALTKIDEERSEIEAGLANAFAVLLFPE